LSELGVPELVVVGYFRRPKQLPEVGRSYGKTIKSFQQLNQLNF
jgi:Sec-independent protein translocase protein TatA